MGRLVLAFERFFTIDSMQTPSDFQIVMQRDGVEILRDARTVAYRNDRPNGPDCSPVCRCANIALTVTE